MITITRPKTVNLLLGLALILAGCAAADRVPPADTDAPLAWLAPDERAHTEASVEEVTDPPETEPPVPIDLPDAVVTDITDNAAREILLEIERISEGMSVDYASTDGQYFFTVRGEEIYPSASTIKVMYCQHLLRRGVDLSKEIPLQAVIRNSWSEQLTSAYIGRRFTVKELMQYTIIDSDNMAYRLLFDSFGAAGFNAYADSIGAPGLKLYGGYEFTKLSIHNLTLGVLDAYRYSIETGDDTLIGLMKNTTHNRQIPAGTQYETAHKYGFEGGTKGYHDTGIVFADTPYALTIMSRLLSSAEGTDERFIAITRLTEQLHELLYSQKGESS